MCQNGCCNTKGCSNIKSIPGPQGEQGEQGIQGVPGINGIDGLPGVGGGLQFEHFFNSVIDTTWTGVETVQPEFNRIIGGISGMYQISLNVVVNLLDNSDGEIRLFVNGAPVQSLIVLNVVSSGHRSYVMFWRGSINNGDLVELKRYSNNGVITTVNGNMLINRES